MSRWCRGWGLLLLVGANMACGALDEERPLVEPPPEASWPLLGCDPLVPSYCAYPFPSNVYTVADGTTPTGRRVAFLPETMPVANDGTTSAPTPLNLADGFSAGAALLAELPGATEQGLARPDSLEASLAADSPTVIIEADTGERVLHFSELDRNLSGATDPSFMIRPAVRLKDATRYIVAIRHVGHRDGGEVAASPAFAALRDKGVHESDPSVDARRALYGDIFERLAAANVPREDLQLAWDFTTASRESNTRWLRHMRDDGLAKLAKSGAKYTITKEEPGGGVEDPVMFRIEGTFTAPLYLDDIGHGGRLVFDSDGLPLAQGDHEVPFGLMIPKSAGATPGALLQYGHGLLGHFSQLYAGNFQRLANDHHYAIFGTTLTGMGDGDSVFIAQVLGEGRVDKLASMFDRLHQGMVDQLLAMRMMRDGFAKDPTYGAFVDPEERYYHGISQGGIFGGTYLAMSTDVERGVLGVMGMPYNLLLTRSVDFTPFFVLMQTSFSDSRDQRLLTSLVQMMWDRTEPNGYVPYLREGSPLGAPPHEVLMRAAVGDHQVTTIGGQLMARAVGAHHLESGLRPVVDLEAVSMMDGGSAYVEYDFGLPPEPLCNIPMSACGDPHGEIRHLPSAISQLDAFLRSGRIQNDCPDGVCRFPELSGCEDGATTPVCSTD